MKASTRLRQELGSLGMAMTFFGVWIGVLILLKTLLLESYHIDFVGGSKIVVGALILSKVVLILEHVSMGAWVRRQPAWIEIVLRTVVYSMGVLLVMALEKGLEGRHAHGGFGAALKAAIQGADSYHLWVNTLCISGALLFYNLLSVIRCHLGRGGLLRFLQVPCPRKTDLNPTPKVLVPVLLCVGLAAATGCHSIGPRTVPRDRFDYSGALAESWKDQMLLNLVKTRYPDLPIYLDVGQIVSGYTLETSGTVGASFPETDLMGGDTAAVGAAVRYTDRPTITYTLLTGDRFLEGFLAPIEPSKVFALMEAGYAADFILELSVNSLNGLHNRSVRPGGKQTPDPEFFRVLELLRDIQDAGAVGLRVDHPTNTLPATVLFFRRDRIDPAVEAQIIETRRLLGVSPGAHSFRLVQSPLPGGEGELAVSTRSMMQILAALSLGVEIPESHLDRRLTPPIPEAPTAEHSLLRIHSGPRRPSDAFVAVPYQGAWFWVANDDWLSKRTFSSILFLFTLAGVSGSQNLPTITIPAQ